MKIHTVIYCAALAAMLMFIWNGIGSVIDVTNLHSFLSQERLMQKSGLPSHEILQLHRRMVYAFINIGYFTFGALLQLLIIYTVGRIHKSEEASNL